MANSIIRRGGGSPWPRRELAGHSETGEEPVVQCDAAQSASLSPEAKD